MTASLRMKNLRRPTVIEVWAPSCAACRAMRSDLEAVATERAGDVELVLVDASRDIESVRTLGVMGTPTMIVVRDGSEQFRVTGRKSRAELEAIFRAAVGDGVVPLARGDIAIRSATGVALIGVGMMSGPVWPLVVAGTLVATWAAVPLVRKKT